MTQKSNLNTLLDIMIMMLLYLAQINGFVKHLNNNKIKDLFFYIYK